MKKVYFYVVLTAFLFGTMEVALKLVGSHLDAFQLTFLRFAIGGILLLPFAVTEMKKNHVKLSVKDLLQLLFVGTLGIPVSMVLFQMGVMHSNASTASVLISINPLFTMVFAHFFAGEKLDRRKMMVLFIGILGIIFMIKPWNLQEGNTVEGTIYMLLAAITFGGYTVAGKVSVKKIGLMAQTSISFILGSLVLLVVIAVMGRPVLAGVAEQLPLVLYVGIFVTGLGYFSYFKAIKMSDASTGSLAFFLKPAIAPVIAVIVLRETILWNTYTGIILILAASYLNIKFSKKDEEINKRFEQGNDNKDIQ